MNWLYDKTERSILAAILIPSIANLLNDLFRTHPDSQMIGPLLLLALPVFLLLREQGSSFRARVRGKPFWESTGNLPICQKAVSIRCGR